MGDTYFTVYNDKNNIQIDDRFKNYIFTRKVRVTAREVRKMFVFHSGEYTVRKAEVDLYDYEVTAAVVPVTSDEVIFSVGINIAPNVDVNKLVIAVDKRQPDFEFDVYIFGDRITPNADKYGLDVFNEKGELVFSSYHKYLNVVCNTTGTITFSQNGLRANGNKIRKFIDIPARHKYGVLPAITPFFFWDNMPQGHRIGLVGYEYTNTGIYMSTFPYHMSFIVDLDGPDIIAKITYPYNYVIADVTNCD